MGELEMVRRDNLFPLMLWKNISQKCNYNKGILLILNVWEIWWGSYFTVIKFFKISLSHFKSKIFERFYKILN